MCPRFAKPAAKPAESRSSEPLHSKGHLSTATLPKIPFHTAWEISYAHRWNTEASVTTLGHSLELCIPDVNTPSPWNPWATRQRIGKLQEESNGRQELFARFPGYLCALLAVLQVCSILHVLSRGSWLLTQMLCEFLGCSVGWERQSPWKNACKNSVHVAIYNNSRRLSLTHGSKLPSGAPVLTQDKRNQWKTHRCRQWIIPGGSSFPQSPQMREYEYFIKCIHKKESPVPYFCQRQEKRGNFTNSTHNEYGCTNWSSAASVANAGLRYFRQINPHYTSHHPLYVYILILFKVFIQAMTWA